MPSHPIDYDLNPSVYSTPEMALVFDEKTRYQRWLDFEAALAEVQGELGIIPHEAADEIRRKAKFECLDLETLRDAFKKSRNSLLPVVKSLRNACEEEHGEYVHYGVTTQDVLDTAEVLELMEALAITYRDLRTLEKICLDLARTHRSTPVVARTHGQQALPTTLGLKLVIWGTEIRRHIDRLQNIAPRMAVGQMGGAVGTMAALGPRAMEIAERTLKRLGLTHSKVPWHTSRDNVGELAGIFSLLSATLAKMANEIFQLQKTEIGELSEAVPGKAASSTTMPHKKNPVLCQRVVVLARHVRYLTGAIVESMVHEHERDPRSLWAEWLAVPQLCIYTGAALNSMLTVMSTLELYPDRMLENLHLQGGPVTSEWLVFRLSPEIGKMKSLDKIHELANRAKKAGTSLKDAVMKDAEIGPLLTLEDLSFMDHPEKYTGHATEIVDHALAEIEEQRKKDPDELW
jgi:adenylosuccinate lyase